MSTYHCTRCNHQLSGDALRRSADAAASCCIAGLVAGASAKNAWAAIGLAVLGAVIGHMIDQEVTPKCPVCGDVLKILASRLLSV